MTLIYYHVPVRMHHTNHDCGMIAVCQVRLESNTLRPYLIVNHSARNSRRSKVRTEIFFLSRDPRLAIGRIQISATFASLPSQRVQNSTARHEEPRWIMDFRGEIRGNTIISLESVELDRVLGSIEIGDQTRIDKE